MRCHFSPKHNLLSFQQQEQDPTNLYLSGLPPNFNEHDLEQMLLPYGQVISTRILRDSNGVSKGVGFARSVTTFFLLCFGKGCLKFHASLYVLHISGGLAVGLQYAPSLGWFIKPWNVGM